MNFEELLKELKNKNKPFFITICNKSLFFNYLENISRSNLKVRDCFKEIFEVRIIKSIENNILHYVYFQFSYHVKNEKLEVIKNDCYVNIDYIQGIRTNSEDVVEFEEKNITVEKAIKECLGFDVEGLDEILKS